VPGAADPAAAATYVTHSRERSIKFAATPPPPHAPSVFAQASLNDRRRRRRRPSLSSRAGGGVLALPYFTQLTPGSPSPFWSGTLRIAVL